MGERWITQFQRGTGHLVQLLAKLNDRKTLVAGLCAVSAITAASPLAGLNAEEATRGPEGERTRNCSPQIKRSQSIA